MYRKKSRKILNLLIFGLVRCPFSAKVYRIFIHPIHRQQQVVEVIDLTNKLASSTLQSDPNGIGLFV
jgi:hypothetical protein